VGERARIAKQVQQFMNSTVQQLKKVVLYGFVESYNCCMH
jgi:hypothetical protein